MHLSLLCRSRQTMRFVESNQSRHAYSTEIRTGRFFEARQVQRDAGR